MKYRKKPVVIEAYQLPPLAKDAPDGLIDWLHSSGRPITSGRDGGITIETLEGRMTAQPGDWIIKDVQGEFYPCKPDIFEQTYEPAE